MFPGQDLSQVLVFIKLSLHDLHVRALSAIGAAKCETAATKIYVAQ